MKVIAAPGTKCPMEGNPRKYITDSEPVEVPESTYYMRLKADGSLVDQPLKAPPAGDGINKEKVSDKEGKK